MVVGKCNKVYRYQIINDSNRYYPSHAVRIYSNLPQHSSPHSNVQKFANTKQYAITSRLALSNLFVSKIEPSGYHTQFITLIALIKLMIIPTSAIKFRLNDFCPVSPKKQYYFQFGFSLRFGLLGVPFAPDSVDDQVNTPF